jgi:hypothetical protein
VGSETIVELGSGEVTAEADGRGEEDTCKDEEGDGEREDDKEGKVDKVPSGTLDTVGGEDVRDKRGAVNGDTESDELESEKTGTEY